MGASIESDIGKDCQITRHQFLRSAAAVLSVAVMPSISTGAQKSRSSAIPRQGFAPGSGPARAFTAEIEAGVAELMEKYSVPCASLALSKEGQVLLNRSFGWATPERKKPLPVASKFRIASVDKMLTKTGAGVFLQGGWRIKGMNAPFDEGTKPFRVFLDAGLKPIPGKTPDERLLDATMKDLLEHRVGWNPPRAMDIMKELELDRMPKEMDFLRWLVSSPLTHGPQDPEKYSNEAFSALRLIIHVVTGDYFKFMQKNIFGPAGAEAKEVGVTRSRPEDREPNEVYYITPRNDPSEFPEDEGRVVPACDAGIYLDHLIILTTTANALVKYADYWNVGTAKKLRNPRTGGLGEWNDNGATISFGSWPGTAAALIQHRHSLMNAALIINGPEAVDGVAMTEKLPPPILNVTDKLQW